MRFLPLYTKDCAMYIEGIAGNSYVTGLSYGY